MTAFWACFTAGVTLAWFGKLHPEGVALFGTLHAFVIARAVSSDKYCGCSTNIPPTADAPAAG